MVSAKDKEQILTLRKASNQAFKDFDIEKTLSFLSEDVLTTAGNGTVIAGKENLRSHSLNRKGKMYWVRTPLEIQVSKSKNLAWETGTWEGFYLEQNNAVVNGKYSAMWSKETGQWLIKSQLFVELL